MHSDHSVMADETRLCQVLACRGDEPARATFVCGRCPWASRGSTASQAQQPFAACTSCLEGCVLHGNMARVGCPQCKQPWPLVELLRMFGPRFPRKREAQAMFTRMWRADMDEVLREGEACLRLQREWADLTSALKQLFCAMREGDSGLWFIHLAAAETAARRYRDTPIRTYMANAYPATNDARVFYETFIAGDAVTVARRRDGTHRGGDGGEGWDASLLYSHCSDAACTGRLQRVSGAYRQQVRCMVEDQASPAVPPACLELAPFRVALPLPRNPTVLAALVSPDTLAPWLLCSACRTPTCPYCYEQVAPAAMTEHACAASTLQALQPMKDGDTRACPRCHVTIEREYGCSHMFCTHCHFRFDWLTGREVTGFFHNPHLMALLDESREVQERERQRAAAVVGSGGGGGGSGDSGGGGENSGVCGDLDVEEEACWRVQVPDALDFELLGTGGGQAPVGTGIPRDLPRHLATPAYVAVWNTAWRTYEELHGQYRCLPAEALEDARYIATFTTTTRGLRDRFRADMQGSDRDRHELLERSMQVASGSLQRGGLAFTMVWQRARQEAYGGLHEAVETVLVVMAEHVRAVNAVTTAAREEWRAATDLERLVGEGGLPAELRALYRSDHENAAAAMSGVSTPSSVLEEVVMRWSSLRRSGPPMKAATAKRWCGAVGRAKALIPLCASMVQEAWQVSLPVWQKHPRQRTVPCLMPVRKDNVEEFAAHLERGRAGPSLLERFLAEVRVAVSGANAEEVRVMWVILSPEQAWTAMSGVLERASKRRGHGDMSERESTRSLLPMYQAATRTLASAFAFAPTPTQPQKRRRVSLDNAM